MNQVIQAAQDAAKRRSEIGDYGNGPQLSHQNSGESQQKDMDKTVSQLIKKDEIKKASILPPSKPLE